VTKLASIPDGMFLMGEDDVRHSLNLRVEREILLHDKRVPLYGDALEKTSRLDESQLLRFFPIQPVPEALFGKRLTESEEVVIGRDLQSIGVATLASLRVLVGQLLGAGLEDGFSVNHPLPVMTTAAVIASLIVCGRDPRGSGLHRKTHVHVTDPAGELGTVDPMLEDDGRKVHLSGVVVDDDPAVFVGKRSFLLDARLA